MSDGDMQPDFVRSEVLCYVFTYIHRSTSDALASCINDFFKPAEIAFARDLLWNAYEKMLSECKIKKQRRSLQPADRNAAKAHALDISTWTTVLVNECASELHTAFFAVDLTNVPPCPPEEVNIYSLVARVSALEKEAARSASNVASLQMKFEQRCQEMQVSQHQANKPQPRLQDQTQLKRSKSSAVPSSQSAPSSDGVSQTEPAQMNAINWAAVATNNSQSWNTATHKRRRQVRMASKGIKEIEGRATGNTIVKASKPAAHLLVRKVDAGTTVDMMKEMLRSSSITPRAVVMTSKEGWMSRSFKLSVNKEDAPKLLSEDFWPEGIACRPWLSTSDMKKQSKPRRSSTHDDDDDNSSSHASSHAEHSEDRMDIASGEENAARHEDGSSN